MFVTALNFLKLYIYLEVLSSMHNKKQKTSKTLRNSNQIPEYSSEVENFLITILWSVLSWNHKKIVYSKY